MRSDCVEKPVCTGFFCVLAWLAERIDDTFGHLLMRVAASPNETGDRTGGLNHAFNYLYANRRAGKRLKVWNRTVYYLVKWLLFGGIAVAIFCM